jgi:hypothetical protein
MAKETISMIRKAWLFTALAVLIALGAAGCAAAGGPDASQPGNAQIANPWVDATAQEAAQLLGGTFYNITTLDGSWEQYALLKSTDDAMKGGLLPTVWVRFRKGDEDVTLQMFKGGKADEEMLAGKQADLKGAMAYILQKDDGTSHIAWEANGLLYTIGVNVPWSDADLITLAQGVKASE